MRRIDGQTLTVILSALGLSGASGLNPWMPLLLAAGFERLGWVTLDPSWAGLGDTPVLAGLAVLFVLDFAADKVPVLDHALHAVGVVAAPVAGTIVFDAEAGDDVSLLVSLLAGGGSAGVLHAARATARPAVNGVSGGIGAPVASLMEDLLALLLVVVAFLLPVVAGLAVLALLIGGVLAARHVRRLLRSSRGLKTTPPPGTPPTAPPGQRPGPPPGPTDSRNEQEVP